MFRSATYACLPLIIVCLSFATVSTPAIAADIVQPADLVDGEYAPGQLLVKFKPDASDREVLGMLRVIRAEPIRTLRQIDVRHLALRDGVSVEDALGRLAESPQAELIDYAEPNWIVTLHDFPSDPLKADLYGVHNVGQTGGTIDADIDALEAWHVTTGSPSVVVGILDTGIDYTHEDLAANIWTNPGEIPDNGVDDDGNGYVDDVRGWDFFNGDNDPMDGHGHGTHTSGTVGAVGDNGIGVVGVAATTTLMPLKILSDGGQGDTAITAEAVLYAASFEDAQGNKIVRVTNNSYGFPRKSRTLQAALEGSGALYVCSAGNDGGTKAGYPAGYSTTLEEVIAVAATDHNDDLASFSNYSSSWVQLGAPGVDTLSCLPHDGYAEKDGTSMAAPHVAGTAALIVAQDPAITLSGLRGAVLGAVDPIPSLAGITVTGGRINARLAVGAAELPADGSAPDTVVDLAVAGVGDGEVTLSWSAPADDAGLPASGPAYLYDIRYMAEPMSGANWDAGSTVTGEPVPAAPGGAETFTVVGLDGATEYWFGVEAYDEAGNRPGPSNVVSAITTGTPDYWQRETVDACDTCGYRKSLAYDPSGNTCIFYTSGTGPRLACWNGASWDIEQVADAGGGVSLAFDPNTNEATVVYVDEGKMWFARKSGSTWEREWIERRAVSYTNTSLAFDPDGRPTISYRVYGSKEGLRFARYDGAEWTVEVVDPGPAGAYNTLRYDPQGLPAIAYSADTNGDDTIDGVRYARFNGTGWDIQTVDGGRELGGYSATLNFDPVTGLPAVFCASYPDWTGRLFRFNGSGWDAEDIGPTRWGSFAFDALGVPQVAVIKSGTATFYRKVNGIWESEIIDEQQGDEFYYTAQPSIAVGPDGEPAVAYQESWQEDLRFAKRSPE
jgi:subtilisin family serine protease